MPLINTNIITKNEPNFTNTITSQHSVHTTKQLVLSLYLHNLTLVYEYKDVLHPHPHTLHTKAKQ